MAKVTGPLFSLTASGQIARTLIYDVRGYVRQYVKPTDAKTAEQGNIRQRWSAAAKVVKIIGSDYVAQIQTTLIENPYNWTATVIRAFMETFEAGRVQWDTLDGAGQTAWESEAVDLGIFESLVTYASEPFITGGEALFIGCYAISLIFKRNGFDLAGGSGMPDGTNADIWAAALTADA